MADGPIRWRPCCVFTACSIGTTLSDGAMGDALYEIASMRLFARLSSDSAPAGSHHHHEFPPPARAASTGPSIVQDHQSLAGRSRRHDDPVGTLVDATIIEAPSSTKNKEQQRDPEMHQTKKGNQWHFGMKAHIGVDAKSGLTHSPGHHRGQRA